MNHAIASQLVQLMLILACITHLAPPQVGECFFIASGVMFTTGAVDNSRKNDGNIPCCSDEGLRPVHTKYSAEWSFVSWTVHRESSMCMHSMLGRHLVLFMQVVLLVTVCF